MWRQQIYEVFDKKNLMLVSINFLLLLDIIRNTFHFFNRINQ